MSCVVLRESTVRQAAPAINSWNDWISMVSTPRDRRHPEVAIKKRVVNSLAIRQKKSPGP
jgi:hypothetical protein